MDATTLKADLAAMIADLPVTFTFNGADYIGTPAELVQTEDLQEGGFLQDVDFNLYVPTYVLTVSSWGTYFPGNDRPDLGDKITVDGAIYKVVRKTNSQDGVGIVLGLNTVRR